MNTRPQIATTGRPQALSATFNQDNSCFSIGLDSGFCVYNTDPCELQISRSLGAGIGVASMLDRANYLALVGGGRSPKFPPNKVIIWDDIKQKAVITLEFRSEVYAVRLSRQRIIVVLIGTVHIYAFSSPPARQHVFETHDNPLGLVALSSKFLAFPGRTPGHVNIFDLATGIVSIIPAHSTPLSAITISPQDDLLATASETGTLIHVYSTATSRMIRELRRGIDKAAIFSLAISPASSRLAVTSDKNTLHVFELPSLSSVSQTPARPSSSHSTTSNVPSGDNRRYSMLSKLPLLPKYFSSEWSAAHAPFEGGGRGALGWIGEDSVVAVGIGGRTGEARWEKFVIVEAENGGGIECIREGWRRYLDND
ncbi:WD40-repeat-containing domain protein [Tuber brumale]|nr:WD40-repeat-containing domain protein [Tuber brumale]